ADHSRAAFFGKRARTRVDLLLVLEVQRVLHRIEGLPLGIPRSNPPSSIFNIGASLNAALGWLGLGGLARFIAPFEHPNSRFSSRTHPPGSWPFPPPSGQVVVFRRPGRLRE